jgi:hypothetical protein
VRRTCHFCSIIGVEAVHSVGGPGAPPHRGPATRDSRDRRTATERDERRSTDVPCSRSRRRMSGGEQAGCSGGLLILEVPSLYEGSHVEMTSGGMLSGAH